MNHTFVIELNRVHKKYVLHQEKPTFVERLIKGNKREFYALRNISFKIQRGEVVGFIGPNGSGKTTLLKIIAGITSPTTGTVETRGKIVSLIGLEAGFHPDLIGRENIYLNGMLLGMKKEEIDKKLNRIIQYADIGEFIDQPLYAYSQGMKLRLSFSIALFAEPDIFLLDEQIQVGDQKFKDKIRNETKLLFNKKKTVIMASHNLYAFFDYCTRIMVLEKGSVVFDGGLEGITYYYKDFTYDYVPPAIRRLLEEKRVYHAKS